MISEWLMRVGSSVPRGFSRYYILGLLQSDPCTGKQIMDRAAEQSRGAWKPSPGLVYPLLGRLLDEGLIEETEDGRYQLTEKGRVTAQDINKINDIVRKQLDVLFRLGNLGRFVATDVIERMISMGTVLSSNAMSMTQEETARYRKFLLSELKALDEQAENGKDVKIE